MRQILLKEGEKSKKLGEDLVREADNSFALFLTYGSKLREPFRSSPLTFVSKFPMKNGSREDWFLALVSNIPLPLFHTSVKVTNFCNWSKIKICTKRTKGFCQFGSPLVSWAWRDNPENISENDAKKDDEWGRQEMTMAKCKNGGMTRWEAWL